MVRSMGSGDVRTSASRGVGILFRSMSL